MLIAPDHFGGNLTATQATEALAGSWLEAGHEVIRAPMSDGARGLVDAVYAARGGTLHAPGVPDASGAQVPAALLHVESHLAAHHGGTAYFEIAPILGPDSVQAPDDSDDRRADALAESGSSAGVGHLLLAAIRTGASRIVIGAGASPTHDAGAGMLQVLADDAGLADPITDLAQLRASLGGLELIVAAARDYPLLGLHGAGAGLTEFGISGQRAQDLEKRTADRAHRMAARAQELPETRTMLMGPAESPKPNGAHTGVGGGVGFALALLGARLLPGSQLVAGEVGLRRSVDNVDLVLTGTDSVDGEALHTGVIATLGEVAAEAGVAVVVLGNTVLANRRELAQVGVSAAYPVIDTPLSPGTTPRPAQPASPAQALATRGARLMRNWATG